MNFREYWKENLDKHSANNRFEYFPRRLTAVIDSALLSYSAFNDLQIYQESTTFYVDQKHISSVLDLIRAFGCKNIYYSAPEYTKVEKQEASEDIYEYFDSIDSRYDFINFEHACHIILTLAEVGGGLEAFSVRMTGNGVGREFIKKLIRAAGNQEYISYEIPKDRAFIYMLSASQGGGMSLTPMKVTNSDLIKTNYSDAVIEEYEYILDQFQSENPNGRICIIHGKPGTGKTYLIRGLIGAIDKAEFIFIPSRLAGNIDDPSFVSLLIGHKRGKKNPLILVIEDADLCLEKRNGSNMPIISSLLNYTDGLLGGCLDLRIISTTNMEKITMDEAVLRSGRLLTKFEIGLLNKKETDECAENLGIKGEIEGPATLADIYAVVNKAKAGIKVKKENKNKIGF